MRSIERAVVLVLAAGVVLAGAAALVKSRSGERPEAIAGRAPSRVTEPAADRGADEVLSAPPEPSSKGERTRAETEPVEARPEPPNDPPPESWERAGIRSAPVRGRVVDSDTGRASSGFQLQLRASLIRLAERGESRWMTERVITDVDGRFTSSQSFPEGWVTARSRGSSAGHRFEDSRHGHLERGRGLCDWTLRVAKGPQLALRIQGPGEVVAEEWEARLVESAPDDEGREWKWRSLLPGDPPRLEYPRQHFRPEPELTASVQVRSLDGVWRGEAPVATVRGVHPGEVVVDARLVGAVLEGRVVGQRGRPLAWVAVRIGELALDGERDASGDFRRSRITDDDGRYRFEGLPAGEFQLVARPGHHEPRSRWVSGPLGTTRVPDFVFSEVAGSISGVVRVPDGPGLSLFALELHPADAEGELRREVFSLLEGDAGDVPFEFLFLDAGVHELVLLPPYDGFFEPVRRLVSAPTSDVALEAPGRVETRRVAIEVLDRDTRQALRASCHIVGRGFPWAMSWWNPPMAGEPLVVEIPRHVPTALLIGSEGYRPIAGDPNEVLGAGGETRLLLERGWGGMLVFRDRDGPEEEATWESIQYRPPGRAVAGVDVFADGERVGRSDRDGIVWLSLPERPQVLTAEKPGWTVEGTIRVQRLDGLRSSSVVSMSPE